MKTSPEDAAGWDARARRRTGSSENAVAVAESQTGHWADRDRPYRKPGTSIPFRRPSATGNAEGVAATPFTAGPAEETTAEQRSRHWTDLGTETRRPRTSDRGEITTPRPERALSAKLDGDTAVATASDPDTAAGDAARVSSILSGGGREIRPHRIAPQVPPPPSQQRRGRLGRMAVVAVLVLAGGALAVYGFAGKWSVLGSDVASTARTVTAPLDGRQAATFELGGVTSSVTLLSDDLGTELYRISTPEESDARPAPLVDEDTVRLSLTAAAGGPSAVEVVLNMRVLWTVRLTGAAQEHRIDLTRGQVAGVTFQGSARGIELSLPTASRTVPVTVGGAIDQLILRAPKDSPVRLKLEAGAKTVAAGEKTLRDVAPGATFTPKDWDRAKRYDVTMASKATFVSIESRS